MINNEKESALKEEKKNHTNSNSVKQKSLLKKDERNMKIDSMFSISNN